LQQLTNHEINGASVPNSKERTLGLGPECSLAAKESGSGRAQSPERNHGDFPHFQGLASQRT